MVAVLLFSWFLECIGFLFVFWVFFFEKELKVYGREMVWTDLGEGKNMIKMYLILK